jgi:hypothetical protein
MTQSNQSHLAPAMGMQASEFARLRADVAVISQGDVHLGRVLEQLLLHVGHLHGFDPAIEDAKAEALARKTEREEEDAQLKADAEARTATRALVDAQPHTPEQVAALQAARATEDAKLKTDAEAMAEARAEEDRLTAEEAAAPVPVASPDTVQEGFYHGN